MARSSNLLVLAVVACATYMLLPSESFTAPQVSLVLIGLLAGTAAVGILALFFYGSYSVGFQRIKLGLPRFIQEDPMARSSNLLVLAVVACVTYMLLPSESFTAPLVLIGLLAGTAAVGILALFFYGSYSGAGSGL
eukprot:s65_g22.t1